ncbi:MAG TPA: NAD-dependent epimerase/dehydratase family protein [Egibacteraceae bacterium]|nr:NAD-dependent epimerase/dehydratase family protein [Actinomycetota bacterium]HWB72568.1 NAD-dependent epimerase/dehydratase family protein [Egibacteraceae bacterium]
MTRVLVTGGAGFIGSTLVDRLLAEGHEVTVVDDLSTGKLANLAQARRDPELPLTFQRLDITSDALERVVARSRPQVVFHLAAQIDVRRSVDDPVRDAMVNVVGTVGLLEACRRHGADKVLLATSGGCIYGEPDVEALPIDEDHPGHPVSPYGASKRGVEEYLHAYASLYGLRWTSLALGNVFGPRQDPLGEAGVVSIFGGRMLADEPVTIYGDGEQTRDFVFVDDVVHAFVLAMERGHGLRLNIGTGQRTSVNRLFAELADLTGYGRPARHAAPRLGELRDIALDARLAVAELGWKPWTTLREGLAATVGWLGG